MPVDKKNLSDSLRILLLLDPENSTFDSYKNSDGVDLDFAEMPEDELTELQARVREKLSEKKPAFDFFKKIHLVFFKKINEDETTIPQDLFLDVRGNLTGQLPQKPFPENFDSFLPNPEHRFRLCLISAAIDSRLQTGSADESEVQYQGELGAQNLEEYLEKLLELELVKEKGVRIIKKAISEDRSDPRFLSSEFLHHFTLNLHQMRANLEGALEAQKEFSVLPNPETKEPGVNMAYLVSVEVASQFSSLETSEERKKELASLQPTVEAARFEKDVSDKRMVGNVEVHFAETIGILGGRKQEDAFIIGESAPSDDSAPIFLQKEFKRIGENLRRQHLNLTQGSTALVASYSTDQTLTIANCGDSRAVLFIKNPDNSVSFLRLSNDQNPENILERKRIENAGGALTSDGKRVVGLRGLKLAIARSMGDTMYRKSPEVSSADDFFISDEPEITQYDIRQMREENPGAEFFLLTSCDGLYSSLLAENTPTEKSYAKALETWFANEDNLQARWTGNVAEYIQDCAICNHSTDNITVCFSNITNPPTRGLTIGVFDGHGGPLISQALASEFGKSLLSQIVEEVSTQEDAVILDSQYSEQSEDFDEEAEIDEAAEEKEEIVLSKKRPAENPSTLTDAKEITQLSKKVAREVDTSRK